MEKKDKNMINSGDVDYHYENHGSYDDRYSELLEVPVKYLKAVEWKLVEDDNNVKLEDLKFVKGMEKFHLSESDELDQERLKAVETLKARLFNLYNAFIFEDIAFFFAIVWLEFWTTVHKQRGILTMIERQNWEAREKKCLDYLLPSSKSTEKLFDEEDIDISALVNLASAQLEKIKAYNSRELVLLQDENMNEVTFQEMGDHYSSIYKGMRSLNMKIDILRFHLAHRWHGMKANQVERFLASVEGELRQYEEQVETTRSKVFESAKKRDKLSAIYMSTFIKTCNVLGYETC